ncbi:MAG: ATPase [Firmicutes bacterium]|nr:ATPase [Bacillota bacterium]
MKTGRIRHFFAGGNTGVGFYSFYDQVVGPDPNRLYILKGGPGTGKSTFMKQIGTELAGRGFDLEYLHCSSDHHSLDGLLIPALKTAFLDGTAPHTIDPVHPGVVDEIINLGAFWNLEDLKAKQGPILATAQQKKACFERAYVYLNAALAVYRNWRKTNYSCLDQQAWLTVLHELQADLFTNRRPTGEKGRLRHLFASAITADGPVHFLDSLGQAASRIYILDGPPGTGRAEILKRLVTTAVDRGLAVEVFHCALDPAKYEHLWFPDLKTAVFTSTWPHKYSPPGDRQCRYIATDTFLKPEQNLYSAIVKEARLVFLDLWARAINWLNKAKKLHADLEKLYLDSMNFHQITHLRNDILHRLIHS